MRVPDLGRGAGHASVAAAPRAKEVVAYDLSGEMRSSEIISHILYDASTAGHMLLRCCPWGLAARSSPGTHKPGQPDRARSMPASSR
jgi:hypothetical protein